MKIEKMKGVALKTWNACRFFLAIILTIAACIGCAALIPYFIDRSMGVPHLGYWFCYLLTGALFAIFGIYDVIMNRLMDWNESRAEKGGME